MSKKKSVFLIISSLLLILLSLGVAYALNLYSQFQHVDLDASDEDLGITAGTQVDTGTDITNIALFGVDTRSDSFTGNSDSIMILSVDKQHNKIKLTSVLRDSLVQVDGYGYTKITEAYGLGGPTLAIKTLNQNFQLDIRDYATINFAGMAEIIDAVGGVTINVSSAEIDMLNGLAAQMAASLGEPAPAKVTQPGPQILNGLQAVAYSRIRKVDNPDGSWGDYGRTDRQRAVMEQLFEKAMHMSPTQYPAFIQSILPYVETSLDIGEILNLATIFSRDNIVFEQACVPSTEYTINAGYSYNGKSNVYYNLDYAAGLIHSFIYDDIPSETYIAQNTPPMTGPLDSSTASAKGSSASSSQKTTSSSKTTTNQTAPSSSSTNKASSSVAASSSSPSSAPVSSAATSSSGNNSSGSESNLVDTGTSKTE